MGTGSQGATQAKELLVIDGCNRRGVSVFLIGPSGCLCSSGWLHTHAHMGNTRLVIKKSGGGEMKLGAGCAGDPGAIEGCGEYEQNTLDRCIKFPTNKKGYLKLMPSSFP